MVGSCCQQCLPLLTGTAAVNTLLPGGDGAEAADGVGEEGMTATVTDRYRRLHTPPGGNGAKVDFGVGEEGVSLATVDVVAEHQHRPLHPPEAGT